MTVKKARVNTDPTPSQLGRLNPFDFIGDVKGEMKKITWTTQDELRTYTKIVVASTFVCGMSIFLIDVFIQNMLQGLGTLVRLISG